MFEKLGVVTNCWAEVMESGTRFEDLVLQFVENGFRQLEIRDGVYLQNSEFGNFIGQIQNAMARYEDTQWQQICDQIHESDNWARLVEAGDRPLWDRVYEFLRMTKDVVFSYAMAHPWLSAPENADSDDACIRKSLKLAYLLCPQHARLRLVDLDTAGDLDQEAPAANLKHYGSLLPDYPVILAVENAKRSATLFLELAIIGNAKLAYDEANIYQLDGTALNTPDEFWQVIKKDDLISIHLKQKTPDGVLSIVGEGFVDFQRLYRYSRQINYDGDWLFENIPSDEPLMDAIKSRTYINDLCS